VKPILLTVDSKYFTKLLPLTSLPPRISFPPPLPLHHYHRRYYHHHYPQST
jgi:hypothetical protein